jgi:hypothetical protein
MPGKRNDFHSDSDRADRPDWIRPPFAELLIAFCSFCVGFLFAGLNSKAEVLLHSPDFFSQYTIEVLSGVTVLLLSAFTVWLQRRYRDLNRRHFEMKARINEAPYRYWLRLDSMISRAIREGQENALVNGKAIVEARNSMAESLVSMSSSLNSVINTLARNVGAPVLAPAAYSGSDQDGINPAPDQRAVWETIQVLERTWAARREVILLQVRKILAELGIPFEEEREVRFEQQTTGD